MNRRTSSTPQPPPTTSPTTTPTTGAATYEIRLLGTAAELQESYRLRYEVYGLLGYIRHNRSKIEIDEYDSTSIPFGAFDRVSGEMVGTLRLVTSERQPEYERLIRLLLEELDDDALSEQVRRARSHMLPSVVSEDIRRQVELFNTDQFDVLELSRAIVLPAHRGGGVSRALMEFGLAYVTRRAPAVLVGSCMPAHLPMYARYGYVKLPETELERFHSVGQIANAVICRTDVLPEPTRSHISELRGAMLSGASELTLDLGRNTRALHRFAAPRRAHRRTMEMAGHCMDAQHLINVFELESRHLDATLRQHPMLRPLFSRNFRGVDAAALKRTYLQLLKLKADYVQFTVPALRAAGLALRAGDEEDRRWSALLLDYAAGETDHHADYGHHIWARDDMKALDAPADLIDAPTHASALLYGAYFVEEAERHPYAILGAKGVLEHFSIRVSDDVVRGVVASGIANAENATRFFCQHGVLDIDHVRQGDRNLDSIVEPHKRFQILEGAYFTSGTYRSLAHYLLPT